MNLRRFTPALCLTGLLITSCHPATEHAPLTKPANDPSLLTETPLSRFMVSAELPANPSRDLLAADALKRAAGYGYPQNATQALQQLGNSVQEQRAAATILNQQTRYAFAGKPSPNHRQALERILKLSAKTDPIVSAERIKAQYLLGKINLARASETLVEQVRAGNARAATKLGELSSGATRSNWLRKGADMGDTQAAVQYWLITAAPTGSAEEKRKAKELATALLQGDAYAAHHLLPTLQRHQTQLLLSVSQGLARSGDYGARAEYGRALLMGTRGTAPQPAAGINELRISAMKGHPLGAVYYADAITKRPDMIASPVEAYALGQALVNLNRRSRTQVQPLLQVSLTGPQRAEAQAMARTLTQQLKANFNTLRLLEN